MICFVGCAQPAPKWEYKTEIVSAGERNIVLMERGKEGWELVSSQIHQKASSAQVEVLETSIEDFPSRLQIHTDSALSLASNRPSVRAVIETDIALIQAAGKDPKKVDVVVKMMKDSHKELLTMADKSKDDALAITLCANDVYSAIKETEKYLNTLHEKQAARMEVVDLSFKRKME